MNIKALKWKSTKTVVNIQGMKDRRYSVLLFCRTDEPRFFEVPVILNKYLFPRGFAYHDSVYLRLR